MKQQKQHEKLISLSSCFLLASSSSRVTSVYRTGFTGNAVVASMVESVDSSRVFWLLKWLLCVVI